LEAVESALRAAVLAAGSKALEAVLRGVGCGRRSEAVVCACGAEMGSTGLEGKRLVTILGEIRFMRSRYECPSCGASRYPGDEELEVCGTSRSPGLRRMMERAGSRETFKEGRDDLRIYAGIAVSSKDVERVAETIGAESAGGPTLKREKSKRSSAKPERKSPPTKKRRKK